MLKGLIGKKIEMSQTFDKHGRVTPLTIIKVLPNYVVQIKSPEKDGYKSAQIGYAEAKKATKSLRGHVKKSGLSTVPRVLRELEFEGELKAGEKVNLDQVLRVGMLVDVTGVSKGKGFAGVVKRWGFSGGPRTHGQSDRERAPGSIGATTTPGRVYKGMKMAGHMGNQQVTIRGLEVVEVNKEKSKLLVKGSLPGARGTNLLIRESKKKKKAFHEPEVPTVPQAAGEKEDTSEAQEAPKEKAPALPEAEVKQGEQPSESGEEEGRSQENG